MLKINYQVQFKKDYRTTIKRGQRPELLREVIGILAEEKTLPGRYRDHKLADSKGYKDVRECHIQPDWLLIYKIQEDQGILLLIRTGSHSDLFKA